MSVEAEMLSPLEAARLLGISRSLVYAMARDGRLPAFQVGSRWVISRPLLVDWIRSSAAAGWRQRPA